MRDQRKYSAAQFDGSELQCTEVKKKINSYIFIRFIRDNFIYTKESRVSLMKLCNFRRDD